MGTLPAQRPPACAGRFYERTPDRCREHVHALPEPDLPRVAALAAVIEEASTPPLLIASTDLTHCGPGFGQSPPPGLTAETFAHQQDRLAIEAIHALDGELLHQTVETHQVTMCGYVPTTAVLFAARTLGVRQAQLVRYATSADVSGDVDRVVGYAGLIML